ncbi:hypothetical protein OGATHE_001352 [Ogataea polymorpha]|uniref:Uncharacterized protein n=1 Tax=Ogataea polymorpha TaxID=460523 RepID=A0A9P8PR96_9ASCO|nr:hypothetical protein OGATHE_001352 [Ogataea polymorpha]
MVHKTVRVLLPSSELFRVSQNTDWRVAVRKHSGVPVLKIVFRTSSFKRSSEVYGIQKNLGKRGILSRNKNMLRAAVQRRENIERQYMIAKVRLLPGVSLVKRVQERVWKSTWVQPRVEQMRHVDPDGNNDVSEVGKSEHCRPLDDFLPRYTVVSGNVRIEIIEVRCQVLTDVSYSNEDPWSGASSKVAVCVSDRGPHQVERALGIPAAVIVIDGSEIVPCLSVVNRDLGLRQRRRVFLVRVFVAQQ